jgi:hypothetical protein
MVRVFVLTVGSLLCALVALFFIPRSWPPSVGGRVAHHHLCTSCGTHRVTRMAAGLQLGVELEETESSRWMLAQADGQHAHSWVYSHKTWNNGIACALPSGRHQLRTFWLARERVGDDPRLLALVREFLSTGDADTQRREEIVAKVVSLDVEAK